MTSKYHEEIYIKRSLKKNSTPSISFALRKGSKWLILLYLLWFATNQSCLGHRILLVVFFFLIVLQWKNLEAESVESNVSWKTLTLASWSQLGLDQLRAASAMSKLLPHWKSPWEIKSRMTIKNPQGPQAIKLLMQFFWFCFLFFIKYTSWKGELLPKETIFLLDAFLRRPHSLKTKECPSNFPKCTRGGGASWVKDGSIRAHMAKPVHGSES